MWNLISGGCRPRPTSKKNSRWVRDFEAFAAKASKNNYLAVHLKMKVFKKK